MFFQLFLAIVWIILYTAAPADIPRHGAGSTILVLTAGFVTCAVGGRLHFRHLVLRSSDLSVISRGAFMERALSTHGIMVLALFSFYFFATDARYYLDLLTKPVPTFGALVFFFFFMAHLNSAMVSATCQESGTTEARGPFSIRNPGLFPMTWMAFAPWFMLSGVSDLLGLISWRPFQLAWQSPWGQAVFLMLSFFGVALFGPFLVIKLWGSRPLPESPLKDFLDGLCERMGLEYAGIVTWPILNHMPTAAVMGIWGRFRYILVTEALLAIATPGELAAVMAHEIGHVKRRHVWYYFGAVAGFSLLAFGAETLSSWAALIFFGRFPALYTKYFSDTSMGAFQAFTQAAFFILFFRYVFGYFMRNFEREADLYIFQSPADPTDLVTCLEKIARFSGKPIDAKSWHHFGIKERMDYVMLAMDDSRWISRHADKVKKSIVAAGVFLAVAGPLSLALATGQMGKGVHEKLVTGVFESLKSLPEPLTGSASLDYADFLFSRGDYSGARSEYERVLALDQGNARAANNLAWMLATCPDPVACDRGLALTLAKRAALAEPLPHILDTLAEALFQNGFFDEAIKAEQEALNGSDPDNEYFQAQLERFKAAAQKAGGFRDTQGKGA
ncbi:MAG: M48 family metalloprotease [Deltaproteobacteria bacterium]|nr:M48 family metalloprotease [Deltaproteobacteria bacterium]